MIMKRFILSLAMMFTVALSTMAMSYEQARERALFLTDKMAYELNLSEEQYEAAYEVNLDYLMSISTYDDLYGTYWTRRNLDLSYILLDWQYNAFCSAAYFYRPLTWNAGVWRFGIYARYPHRTYFYFGRPAFYATYCGGHSWRMNGGRSWYHGRSYGPRPGDSRFGMRDRYDRGDYRGSRNHGGGFNADRRPGRNDGFNTDRRPGRNDGNRPGNDNGRPGRGYRPGNDNNGQNRGWNNRNNGGSSVYRGGTDSGNSGRNIDVSGKSKPQDRGRAADFSTLRSSTRTTVDRVQNVRRDNVNTFNGGSSTRMSVSTSRPAQTFTPSSSSVSRNSGFNSRPSNRGSSFSSGHSSRSGSFGGGHSNNGGGRSGGGGGLGGRR